MTLRLRTLARVSLGAMVVTLGVSGCASAHQPPRLLHAEFHSDGTCSVQVDAHGPIVGRWPVVPGQRGFPRVEPATDGDGALVGPSLDFVCGPERDADGRWRDVGDLMLFVAIRPDSVLVPPTLGAYRVLSGGDRHTRGFIANGSRRLPPEVVKPWQRLVVKDGQARLIEYSPLTGRFEVIVTGVMEAITAR